MVQTLAATEVTLKDLKQAFGLQQTLDPTFFSEWSESDVALSENEQQLLDRVKANFTELMEDPPMLENSVKMVVLAPLLDLAGFYHKPFRIETEASIDLEAVILFLQVYARSGMRVLIVVSCLLLKGSNLGASPLSESTYWR